MTHFANASRRHAMHVGLLAASMRSPRTVLLGIVASLAALFLVIAVAPLLSFPLTLALAAGWCAWLERRS